MVKMTRLSSRFGPVMIFQPECRRQSDNSAADSLESGIVTLNRRSRRGARVVIVNLLYTHARGVKTHCLGEETERVLV